MNVAIDFETAECSRESACPAGLVRFENGIELETFGMSLRGDQNGELVIY
ncbi:MAG: hypothetical protein LBD47_00070 [Treponema sp.]|jgi:hypothetical protein|nr:hypothetical protein [Treponema sp.]